MRAHHYDYECADMSVRTLSEGSIRKFKAAQAAACAECKDGVRCERCIDQAFARTLARFQRMRAR
jgi:hypothetical protein